MKASTLSAGVEVERVGLADSAIVIVLRRA
jgi:hypothetical protein